MIFCFQKVNEDHPVIDRRSTHMRHPREKTSFLPPPIHIDLVLPDGPCGGFLECVHRCRADIPDAGHDPKRAFTKCGLHGDGTCAWCVRSASAFSLRMAPNIELADKTSCIRRTLEEQVDIIDVCLGGYIVTKHNQPELELAVYVDDDGGHSSDNPVAPDDPDEIAALPLPLVVVGNFGSIQ